MGLQAALGNQGQIALHRGEAAAALAFTEEKESLCRAMNYPLGLAQCLNLKGTALNMMGRSAEAQAAWEDARELVGRHGLRRG
ncbi:MAG: hypothetical protein E4G90_10085 [Gemmatimonadales bacterium]|nr:MAG: hypothetical protein E4G90_10085 [Gemmatimonadales bacterium]